MENKGPLAGVGAAFAAVAVFVGHQAGWLSHVIGESGGLRGIGQTLDAADRDSASIRSAIAKARAHGGNDKLLEDALCHAATAAVDDKPFDVPSFLSEQLVQRLTGIPSLESKLDEFEAGLELSRWNSGTANAYWRACVFRL